MAEDEPKIRITKMEAARRQLRTAIRLWFEDEDPIAIHTLASAAHDILHTLYRRKGMKGLLFDSKEVKDEFRAEWARGIKASANFFKHADRDADGTFEFIPFLNEILLFFSVTALEKMGETLGIEEHGSSLAALNFSIKVLTTLFQLTLLRISEVGGNTNF